MTINRRSQKTLTCPSKAGSLIESLMTAYDEIRVPQCCWAGSPLGVRTTLSSASRTAVSPPMHV